MTIINIELLLLKIPELCNLFLYGFIFMTIFTWITNIKLDVYIYVLWGLFVNYIIINMYALCHVFILSKYDISEPVKILTYSFTAMITPFFITELTKKPSFRNFLSKYVHKTVNSDLLDDVIDFNKRTIITAYLKNSDVYYRGILFAKDEHGNDSYISLIKYAVYDRNDNEVILDMSKDDVNSSVLINLRDTESVELYYEDDSDVWKWMTKDL